MTFAAGMADGMLSVQRRRIDGDLTKPERRGKAFQTKIDQHSYKPSKVSDLLIGSAITGLNAVSGLT